jgi:DeoR/GlpR family transcriptional regulator of sugar metabolism
MTPDRPLPTSVRRARILEHIQAVGGASLAELAAEHDVSTITVHRDLEQLSRDGLVVRFHGGARAAVASEGSESRPGTAWDRRLREAPEAKDAIAVRARAMVRDGDTIFLDASATTFALAHRLDEEPAEDLTIVTTSPAIALGLDPGTARVIVAPGEVDLRMRAIADGWTVEFLRRIKVDVAFVSGSAFDLAHGLTTSRRPLADTLAAVRESADRVVALVDGSKLGRSAMLTMVPAAALDALVVDDGADAEQLARYREAGLAVMVAPTSR